MKISDLILISAFFSSFNGFALAEYDPAEISIGERLFLETRFAQAYYANPGKADAVVDKTQLVGASLKSPFAGKTMNCRACHMVDEHADNLAAGMRSYADYASRPPVSARSDGAKTSTRNSMSMVNVSIAHEANANMKDGALFHFDGEFNSMEDLVRATLTGRNFGWQATEFETAIKHVASIIREDNGQGELAKEFGGSYKKVLTGTDKTIPSALKLAKEYRVNVNKASDKEIFDAVAKLIAAYVTDLAFAKNERNEYSTSPYDQFIKQNKLPRKPAKNESLAEYNQRLLKAVSNLKQPAFIKAGTQQFASHKQDFVFGKQELEGMKLFFRKGSANKPGGNCASCHTAPDFSDFGFHNTGISQHNYDAIHDYGAFMKLEIPGLKKRNKNYDNYLPKTTHHPHASSRFRGIASKTHPGVTDLGLWNVFANPDMPAPQEKLSNILCFQLESSGAKANGSKNCSKQALLNNSIAAFKTPVLRDLGHSGPYMHTGQFNELQEVVMFYISGSALAKSRQLRNPAPQLSEITLTDRDIEPLVAFLNALNEDYE